MARLKIYLFSGLLDFIHKKSIWCGSMIYKCFGEGRPAYMTYSIEFTIYGTTKYGTMKCREHELNSLLSKHQSHHILRNTTIQPDQCISRTNHNIIAIPVLIHFHWDYTFSMSCLLRGAGAGPISDSTRHLLQQAVSPSEPGCEVRSR
jgi:hypothetical protein